MKHGWKVNGTTFRSHIKNRDLISFLLFHEAIADGVLTFQYAALHAPLEVVDLLFSHGATLPPGSSALHAAAEGDAPDRNSMIAYLLDHGADINEVSDGCLGDSEGGRSGQRGIPWHEEGKWGNEEAKACLLAHGADPKAKNELRETPAEWVRKFKPGRSSRLVRYRRAVNAKYARERGTREGGEGND